MHIGLVSICWLVRGLSDLRQAVASSLEVWAEETLAGRCGFTWQAPKISAPHPPPPRHVLLWSSVMHTAEPGLQKAGRKWVAPFISPGVPCSPWMLASGGHEQYKVSLKGAGLEEYLWAEPYKLRYSMSFRGAFSSHYLKREKSWQVNRLISGGPSEHIKTRLVQEHCPLTACFINGTLKLVSSLGSFLRRMRYSSSPSEMNLLIDSPSLLGKTFSYPLVS